MSKIRRDDVAIPDRSVISSCDPTPFVTLVKVSYGRYNRIYVLHGPPLNTTVTVTLKSWSSSYS